MKIDEISDFARRKGFFWTASEIYGGFQGFYDYGPNGTLLKRHLENLWRKYFLGLNENFFEIETAEIMPEKVFEASGHLVHFVDPMAKCKKCGTHHRADHIIEDFLHKSFEGITPNDLSKLIKDNNIKCPKCKGELGDVSILNMMFPLEIGADKSTKGFLRPETAQGAYVNFSRNFEILRNKLPLGLAIIGKAYRNEISPRQLTTRMREFTQAELQIFFDAKKTEEHPDWEEVAEYRLVMLQVSRRDSSPVEITCEDVVEKWNIPRFYVWHLAKVQQFFLDVLKVPKEKFRFKELGESERAFYNKIHWDIELDLQSLDGFKEVGGVHYRTSHDLSGHEKVSGESQEIFYDGRKFIPHVLELSFGIDRIVYSLIELFYRHDGDRIILALPADLEPVQVAVFPLVNKDKIDTEARKIFKPLKEKFSAVYDDSGSIGKRYYREDERGTAYCITVDYDTQKKYTVTMRDRDSTQQVRVKVKDLGEILEELLSGKIPFEKSGKLVKQK